MAMFPMTLGDPLPPNHRNFGALGYVADWTIYFVCVNFFFFLFFIFNDLSETNYLRIRGTDFRNLFTERKRFGC